MSVSGLIFDIHKPSGVRDEFCVELLIVSKDLYHNIDSD